MSKIMNVESATNTFLDDINPEESAEKRKPGRPAKIKDDPKAKRISLVVRQSVYDALKVISWGNDSSINEEIDRILKDYIEQHVHEIEETVKLKKQVDEIRGKNG